MVNRSVDAWIAKVHDLAVKFPINGIYKWKTGLCANEYLMRTTIAIRVQSIWMCSHHEASCDFMYWFTSIRILSVYPHSSVCLFLKSEKSDLTLATCSYWWPQTSLDHVRSSSLCPSLSSTSAAEPNGCIMGSESLLKYSTCLWGFSSAQLTASVSLSRILQA